jgi:hypothetical protein
MEQKLQYEMETITINFTKTEIKEGKRKLHPDWKCKRFKDGTLIIYKKMNNIVIAELMDTLDKITWDILEKNPEFDKFCGEWGLTFIDLSYSAGYGFVAIKILGYDIWCSENDEREWVEENDDYEEFETYIYRKINELKTNGVLNIEL